MEISGGKNQTTGPSMGKTLSEEGDWMVDPPNKPATAGPTVEIRPKRGYKSKC